MRSRAVGSGSFLEAIPPREYCRLLHRPEVEPLAASLEDTLHLVMEEAAHGVHASGGLGDHRSTEDQVNMPAEGNTACRGAISLERLFETACEIAGAMGCCTKPLARQGLPGGVIYKHFAPVLGARQGG
jgi:hypothetical protein